MAARLIAAEQLYDRPPPWVVLVIDIGEFLTASGLHDKAAGEILDDPR
jgi:hypothetical protein